MPADQAQRLAHGGEPRTGRPGTGCASEELASAVGRAAAEKNGSSWDSEEQALDGAQLRFQHLLQVSGILELPTCVKVL